MADMNDIVKLANDAYHGTVEKYSVSQANDALREALIEANNGSTKVDLRAIRDGKCQNLFALIETILANNVVEGLTRNAIFDTIVEFRNVAAGDQPAFIVRDESTLFQVAEIANGTQAIRRQRIGAESEVLINTAPRAVRIYEEIDRILAGRVDFSDMVNRVAASFENQLLTEVYALWAGVSAEALGGEAYFPTAGSYSEDALLDVIDHVEAAANGRKATLLGTRKALRKLKESIASDEWKSELHNEGVIGLFYGVPCVVLEQRHKVGTTEFVLPDDTITVVAGEDKPVKIVYEGDPFVFMNNPTDNMDLTQELNEYASVA